MATWENVRAFCGTLVAVDVGFDVDVDVGDVVGVVVWAVVVGAEVVDVSEDDVVDVS